MAMVTDRDPNGRLTAEYWLRRAEEARTLASTISDRNGRGTVEKIARLYEQMASGAVRREAPASNRS